MVFFPAFDWAISASHPEREERLLYTRDQLLEEGLFDIPGITEYRPAFATHAQLERAHFCLPSAAAVSTVRIWPRRAGPSALPSLVLEGREQRAFALVRPRTPRHARGARQQGFCNINNEAVMVEYIRDHYPHPVSTLRIAIVDTDVHHGDGNQDIFWNDPPTPCSFRCIKTATPCTPALAFCQNAVARRAWAHLLNIPLPPETSDEGYLYAIEHAVLPILEDFKPDLIINSAGQDNHFTDPLANMKLSAQGYAALNAALQPHIAVPRERLFHTRSPALCESGHLSCAGGHGCHRDLRTGLDTRGHAPAAPGGRIHCPSVRAGQGRVFSSASTAHRGRGRQRLVGAPQA